MISVVALKLALKIFGMLFLVLLAFADDLVTNLIKRICRRYWS